MKIADLVRQYRIYFFAWIAVLMLFVAGVQPVYAETNIAATIAETSDGWVAARSGPGANYEIMHKLATNKPIVILDQVSGTDGNVWCKIKYNLNATGEEKISYVRSDLVVTSEAASTETVRAVISTGTINANNVYLRDNAGTNGTNKLTSLYIGDTVSIVGQTVVSGATWYNVNCTKNNTNYTGWVYGTYVTIQQASADDPEYAQSLRNAGFPESYIAPLCALHALHPSWTFEAVNTGLEWSTVIEKESANGKNLVQTSANDSKKSTAEGAYNWKTNKWTIYDGSSWVSASPEYIAYCMDPRNFLNETNIFQFESLSYKDSQNITGVQAILNNTFMANSVQDADGTTLSYDQAFVDIGRSTGVSPYHLAARVKQEQGALGTSSLISGTYPGYEGYYNYFNINAYGSTSAAVIQSGLTYAKNKGWDTRYKSLSGGANTLGNNYIKKGQDTLYFQKFNVVYTQSLYSHQYMANVSAAITESKTVASGYADKNQAFVFRIPIYNNMPAEAVSFTDKGNPNNYLKDLLVSGFNLTPTFSGDITTYSVVVDNAISVVNISAVPVASTSTVAGTGNINLNVGNNVVEISCKSQSGDTRKYTINISRLANGENASDYTISSSKYKLGTAITGIAPGTKVSTFLKNISASKGTVKVLKSSGKNNTGVISTGNKVVVCDESGNIMSTYNVVIYGDMNGDGAVNALDMIKLNRHILGISKLSGVYLEAADVNRKNDGINALDMIILNRHTIGLSTIKQS